MFFVYDAIMMGTGQVMLLGLVGCCSVIGWKSGAWQPADGAISGAFFGDFQPISGHFSAVLSSMGLFSVVFGDFPLILG